MVKRNRLRHTKHNYGLVTATKIDVRFSRRGYLLWSIIVKITFKNMQKAWADFTKFHRRMSRKNLFKHAAKTLNMGLNFMNNFLRTCYKETRDGVPFGHRGCQLRIASRFNQAHKMVTGRALSMSKVIDVPLLSNNIVQAFEVPHTVLMHSEMPRGKRNNKYFCMITEHQRQSS